MACLNGYLHICGVTVLTRSSNFQMSQVKKALLILLGVIRDLLDDNINYNMA